jgi:hypothetical protein
MSVMPCPAPLITPSLRAAADTGRSIEPGEQRRDGEPDWNFDGNPVRLPVLHLHIGNAKDHRRRESNLPY